MKKNILMPTDFSDNAWTALIYALKLYQDIECKFYLLHSTVIKVSKMSNLSNKLLETMTENELKELKKVKALAEKTSDNDKHSFATSLTNDDFEQAIEYAIKKYKIDFVVMGTKGASKTKGILFGSNTVHVMKHVKSCPILIVPDGFEYYEPKQIVFPTDFKRFYSDELEPLKDLASLYESKIKILHVNKEDNLTDAQNYNLAMLKAYLEDYPHTFHWMPNYAVKTEEINDFITANGIDILVMINYKRSFFESIVKEPVIKNIGFRPQIPFLVIPAK